MAHLLELLLIVIVSVHSFEDTVKDRSGFLKDNTGQHALNMNIAVNPGGKKMDAAGGSREGRAFNLLVPPLEKRDSIFVCGCHEDDGLLVESSDVIVDITAQEGRQIVFLKMTKSKDLLAQIKIEEGEKTMSCSHVERESGGMGEQPGLENMLADLENRKTRRGFWLIEKKVPDNRERNPGQKFEGRGKE